MIEEQVHEIVADVQRLAAEGKLDERTLHLAVDAYQRLLDYFDQLLESDLPTDSATDPDTVANIVTRLL